MASILAGIGIGIGLLLFIVPGLWLLTIWAVIVPAIVIGQSGALASFGYSRTLVRGNGWHVFGTLVLVFLILIAGEIVLGLILARAPGLAPRRHQQRCRRNARRPVPRAGSHADLLPALGSSGRPWRRSRGGPAGATDTRSA